MLSRTLSSFHRHSPSTTSSAQSSDNEDDNSDEGGSSSNSKRRSRGLFRAFSRKSRRRKPSPYAGRDGGAGSSNERGSSTERESQKAASENGDSAGAGKGAGSLSRSGSINSSLYGPASSTSVNNASSSSVELPAHAPGQPPSDDESSSSSSDDNGDAQRTDDDEEEESDDPWENDYRDDPEVRANTSANSGTGKRAAEYLESEIPALAVLDVEPEDGPNLVKSPSTSSTAPFGHHHLSAGPSNSSLHSLHDRDNQAGTLRPSRPHSRRHVSQTGSINSVNSKDEYPLVSSRPLHERNRCTITLTHGDPDGFIKGTTPSNANRKPRKQKKTYVVASDLSEESYYAIEWAIGTVLRNGDELLFVTVMETDSKLDPDDTRHYEKTQKIRNQHERQTRVLQLSREATALIERTRLHIRVLCQAIHAKNARHMLVDLIDYFHPTMVIVGSRGLGKLKGIILGSVSHYLIQKSSSPVMVTRRRLKPPQKPRKTYDLQREPRVDSLADAAIDKESHTGVVQSSDEEGDAAPSDAAKATTDSGASSAATTSANTPTTPSSAVSMTVTSNPSSSSTGGIVTEQGAQTLQNDDQSTKASAAQESTVHVKKPEKPVLQRRGNSEDIVQVRAESGDIEEEEDEDNDNNRADGRVDRHNGDDSDEDAEAPSTELQSSPLDTPADLDSKGRVVEDAKVVDKAEEAERQVEAVSQEIVSRKGE